MTTPGPPKNRWRVRRSTGKHPVLDAKAHPFTATRCPQKQWEVERSNSFTDPKENEVENECRRESTYSSMVPHLTVAVKERLYNNGEAKILRPWRIVEREEPVRARSPDAATSPCPSETTSEEPDHPLVEESELNRKALYGLFIKVGIALPVAYQLLDHISPAALRWSSRALSLRSVGSVLHLMALPNGKIKTSIRGKIGVCIALISAVGVAKLKQYTG